MDLTPLNGYSRLNNFLTLFHCSCSSPFPAFMLYGWFQWLPHNQLLTSWEEFTRALELWYGPSSFENHQHALFKLQQTCTVLGYPREFEWLGNRVVELLITAKLDCFLSSLKPEIRNELAILNPAFISQAIGLAKLVETKLQATQTLFPNPLRMPYPKSQSSLATYTTQQINTPYPFLNQVPTPN